MRPSERSLVARERPTCPSQRASLTRELPTCPRELPMGTRGLPSGASHGLPVASEKMNSVLGFRGRSAFSQVGNERSLGRGAGRGRNPEVVRE
jgi:hypothetical protein